MARTLNFKLPVQVLRSMRACKLCEAWRLLPVPQLVVWRCRAASEGPAFGHRRQPTSQYANPRRADGCALSCSCACKRQSLRWQDLCLASGAARWPASCALGLPR